VRKREDVFFSSRLRVGWLIGSFIHRKEKERKGKKREYVI